MYSATFISDNGEKYVFGPSGNTACDIDFGSGISVNIGTSQGFAQVGVTVENQTVDGRTITITGAVYGNVPERKKIMRRIFTPFTEGRLIFENTHYSRVYVKSSPSFSTSKNNGLFSMQFFSPFPFFRATDEKSVQIGAVTPAFRFPVNYGTTHKFGEKSNERYTNIFNSGEVKVPFRLNLRTSGTSTNITVVNIVTKKTLKINGELAPGDVVSVYRDSNNVLRAELTTDGVTSDILSWIDEASDLFELDVGDNLISATDDEGGASLTAHFLFEPAVVALYES